jgi:hypothetical protein
MTTNPSNAELAKARALSFAPPNIEFGLTNGMRKFNALITARKKIIDSAI